MKSMTLGLDLAKDTFHLVDQDGKRKKLRRTQVLKHFSNLSASHIAMEACGSAHYWSRELQKLGHTTSLLPPQHVKAYARGQKNDYNDAQAILECHQHGKVRAVATKDIEQQDQQSLLRMRALVVSEQTRLCAQIRSLLSEYGIVIPQGKASVKSRLPEILDGTAHQLTPLMRELLHRQYQRLLFILDELKWYDQQITEQAKQDDDCCRLQGLPGIGPVNSYAIKVWMGDGRQFQRGRHASAALGVVPRQHTSGDKVKLSGITKKGDSYVRCLLIHGARSVVTHAGNKNDPLSQWIQGLVERRGFNKAVVALANKLIRMAWVILSRKEHYRPAVAA